MQEINVHISARHGTAVANHRLPLVGEMPLVAIQRVACGAGTYSACRLCGGGQHGGVPITKALITSARYRLRCNCIWFDSSGGVTQSKWHRPGRPIKNRPAHTPSRRRGRQACCGGTCVCGMGLRCLPHAAAAAPMRRGGVLAARRAFGGVCWNRAKAGRQQQASCPCIPKEQKNASACLTMDAAGPRSAPLCAVAQPTLAMRRHRQYLD